MTKLNVWKLRTENQKVCTESRIYAFPDKILGIFNFDLLKVRTRFNFLSKTTLKVKNQIILSTMYHVLILKKKKKNTSL